MRSCKRRPCVSTLRQRMSSHVDVLPSVRSAKTFTVSLLQRYGRCISSLSLGPNGSLHPFGLGIPACAALSTLLLGSVRFFRHLLPSAPSPFLAVGIPRVWGA